MRVIVSGQTFPSLDSLTKATVGFTAQLSASSITTVGSGAGAGPYVIDYVAGLLAVGAMLSLIENVYVQSVTLPAQSV